MIKNYHFLKIMCALLKVTLKLYPDLDLNIQSEVSAEGAK